MLDKVDYTWVMIYASGFSIIFTLTIVATGIYGTKWIIATGIEKLNRGSMP